MVNFRWQTKCSQDIFPMQISENFINSLLFPHPVSFPQTFHLSLSFPQLPLFAVNKNRNFVTKSISHKYCQLCGRLEKGWERVWGSGGGDYGDYSASIWQTIVCGLRCMQLSIPTVKLKMQNVLTSSEFSERITFIWGQLGQSFGFRFVFILGIFSQPHCK